MTTMNKVIEQVDGLKPNTFGKEEKFRWLCELDGMVKRLVHQEPEGVNYAFPDDMDTPLLIPPPFEGLYALYLLRSTDTIRSTTSTTTPLRSLMPSWMTSRRLISESICRSLRGRSGVCKG